VVVTAISIVIIAAQAEGVDEHLVGLGLVGPELGEESVELRVGRGERRVVVCRGRSWTCGLVLRPVSFLTFCRANCE
jgi:hypothetical protein